MPELPEVETTRRGIAPHVVGHQVTDVIVREARLRWPVPRNLQRNLLGQVASAVRRRAKYLLIEFGSGTLIVHLGMSGSLRLVDPHEPPRKHDHIDIVFAHGRALRLHDPRRFGAMLWTTAPASHPLLRGLGPEPWDVTAKYLYTRSRGRRQAVKCYIMDSRTVVGIGNIYAAEALFLAHIHPKRAAGRIALAGYERLAKTIVQVVEQALALGGTTLRDFVSANGEPGYFRQALRVYERSGEPCRVCKTPIRRIVMTGRASYYCPHCQH